VPRAKISVANFLHIFSTITDEQLIGFDAFGENLKSPIFHCPSILSIKMIYSESHLMLSLINVISRLMWDHFKHHIYLRLLNKNHRFLLSFSKCYHFGPAKSDHIISHTKKGNNWLDLLQCDLYSETVGCLLVQIPPPTLNFSCWY